MAEAGAYQIVRLGPRVVAPNALAQAGGSAVPESLDAFVVKEYPRIRRLAWRFGIPRDEVDDAAQEVFAKVWANREQFKGTSSFATWLTRIAINHFSTRVRRGRLWVRAPVSEMDGVLARSASPRDRAETNEAYILATDCIRRLSRKQREAFVLRYLEDMSYAEAGEVLGIPEGTVRARAFEARKHLHEMLKEYEL